MSPYPHTGRARVDCGTHARGINIRCLSIGRVKRKTHLGVVLFVLLQQVDAQLGEVDEIIEFLVRRHNLLTSEVLCALCNHKNTKTIRFLFCAGKLMLRISNLQSWLRSTAEYNLQGRQSRGSS